MTIDFYNQHAKDFYENTVHADMKNLYEPFINLLPPKGHILDAGCGSGRDSLYFLHQGYQVTAIDASEELVKLSSKLIGQPVLHKRFQNINLQQEFHGVWACASLLHVMDEEIDDVLYRIHQSLKPNGIFYCSFKYGNKKEQRDGRFFRYYDEESLKNLLRSHPYFKTLEMKKTKDVREDRANEYWLNVYLSVK